MKKLLLIFVIMFISISIWVGFNTGNFSRSLDLFFLTNSIRAKIDFLVEVPDGGEIEIVKLVTSITNLQLAKTMNGMEGDPQFNGWLEKISASNAEIEVSRDGILPTPQIKIRTVVSIIAVFTLIVSSFLSYKEIKKIKKDKQHKDEASQIKFESNIAESPPRASNPRAIQKNMAI